MTLTVEGTSILVIDSRDHLHLSLGGVDVGGKNGIGIRFTCVHHAAEEHQFDRCAELIYAVHLLGHERERLEMVLVGFLGSSLALVIGKKLLHQGVDFVHLFICEESSQFIHEFIQLVILLH